VYPRIAFSFIPATQGNHDAHPLRAMTIRGTVLITVLQPDRRMGKLMD
jgi:hypothetical protein